MSLHLSAEDISARIQPIWAEILSKSHVTPADNFFECGGDSIMALNMTFSVAEILGFEVDPTFLFKSPTLESFSSAVADAISVTQAAASPSSHG